MADAGTKDDDLADDEIAGFGPLPERGVSGRGPLILIIFVVVTAAIAALAWNTYQQGVRTGGRDAPPRISAPEDGFKDRPDDPGGYEAPDQDKQVFELGRDGENGDERADAGASLRDQLARTALDVDPSPTPTPTPTPAPSLTPDAAADEDDLAGGVGAAEAPPAPVRIIVEDPPVSEANEEPSATEPQTVRRTQPTPDPEPLPRPDRAAASPDTGALTDEGWSHAVQLASYRNASAAEAGWIKLSALYRGVLAGRSPDIVSAEIGSGGPVYRLRVGGFQTRTQAVAFCEDLKAAGGQCFATRR